MLKIVSIIISTLSITLFGAFAESVLEHEVDKFIANDLSATEIIAKVENLPALKNAQSNGLQKFVFPNNFKDHIEGLKSNLSITKKVSVRFLLKQVAESINCEALFYQSKVEFIPKQEISYTIYFSSFLTKEMKIKDDLEAKELINFFKNVGIEIYNVEYMNLKNYAVVKLCQTNQRKLDSYLFLVDTKLKVLLSSKPNK